ncbi:3'-5' exoribonuclease [Sphingomonas sp. LHG3406-1]|uniref:3'-5' exoribonuclease n=1 Tax=Sphingomonas sp. LHG3406-1 TaxID=2804617 RepID=UPI002606261E|nr:3'-5' exoribonuclease [Sphingomonas sp. LHG3406-1]
MRYFLDCEFDGFGGPLISLALVPADGGEEYYAVVEHERPCIDWVERHVIPYLDTVPQALRAEPQPRASVARELARWFEAFDDVEILADWPDDIAYFCRLLMTGPGEMVTVPAMSFRLLNLAGFSTARNSAVPHNALHDARALRDHVVHRGY